MSKKTKTNKAKTNKAVNTNTQPRYHSEIIFDGQKKNNKFYTKSIVVEKHDNKATSLSELNDFVKKFKTKMKSESDKNQVSVMAKTPIGWRTMISYDKSVLMEDDDFDDYFSNRIHTSDIGKFTEVSQFILSVKRPIVSSSKSGYVKINK